MTSCILDLCQHLLETVTDPTLHSDVGFAVHIENLNNIQQLSLPPYSNGLSTFHNASQFSLSYVLWRSVNAEGNSFSFNKSFSLFKNVDQSTLLFRYSASAFHPNNQYSTIQLSHRGKQFSNHKVFTFTPFRTKLWNWCVRIIGWKQLILTHFFLKCVKTLLNLNTIALS